MWGGGGIARAPSCVAVVLETGFGPTPLKKLNTRYYYYYYYVTARTSGTILPPKKHGF